MRSTENNGKHNDGIISIFLYANVLLKNLLKSVALKKQEVNRKYQSNKPCKDEAREIRKSEPYFVSFNCR